MSEGLMDPAPPKAGAAVFETAPEFDSGQPDWFLELRQNAWTKFQQSSAPARNDEAWRYANFKRLPSPADNFCIAEAVSEEQKAEIIQKSPASEGASARFIFANGQLLIAEVLQESAGSENGAVIKPLEQAVAENGDLVRKYFAQREAALGSACFAALNLAHAGAGVFAFVPSGIEISGPIEIYHWVTGDRASIFPSVTVHAEAGASVSVLEHFNTLGETSVFVCGATSLEAEDSASIRHAIAQDLSRAAKVVQINHAVSGAESDVRSLALHAGGDWIRQESESHIIGKDSKCNLLAVNLLFDDQFVDHRTLQKHSSSDAFSDLLYKNALFDRSHSVFSGLIVVDEGAHRTDAFQTCRNLLLSDEAEANSMPGLEINADQVKCSHGATSGQIDDEEIFYLLSRGIPPAAAKRLVILGFAQDVIRRLESSELEAPLSALLDRELERTNRKGRA